MWWGVRLAWFAIGFVVALVVCLVFFVLLISWKNEDRLRRIRNGRRW